MESKKTKKSNLENKKVLFMEIGLLVALSVALIAFEWTSSTTNSNLAQAGVSIIDVEEDIINTFRKEPPKVEPPKMEPIEIVIVDNHEEIIDELNIEDMGVTQTDVIELYEFDTPEEVVDDQPFFIVEDMPQFKGGDLMNFVKYINKHLKYPAIAAENGIEGKVIIQFVVSKNGKVKDVVLYRGADPALDKEALRIVSSSPDWKPGKQRGVPVNVSFTVPINFKLQ